MSVRLHELPPPPSGKTGFPWTEESAPLPPTMPDGSPWPRVSIVTPSFNQAAFIEETLRSVLLQGYPNLEYRVLDGQSTDESVEIIRRYAPWLNHWVSEPDHGQADAITQGWTASSGEILAYLNSDDTYLPNAIATAARVLHEHPNAAAVCGGELAIDKNGFVISATTIDSATFHDFLAVRFVPQPAIFIRRHAWLEAGGFDPQFESTFDFDLWSRIVQCGEIVTIPTVLATTRWHPATKTLRRRRQIAEELTRVMTKLFSSPAGARLSARERRYALARLNYILLSIDLDDPVKYFFQAITHALRAMMHWLPITIPVGRMVVGNLIYHVWLFVLRDCMHRQIDEHAPKTTRVPWNQWQATRAA